MIQQTDMFMETRRRERVGAVGGRPAQLRTRAAGFVVMLLVLAFVAITAFMAFVASGDSGKGQDIKGPAPAEAPANPPANP
jgi:hypothetical protein